MLTVALSQLKSDVKLYADIRTGNASGFISDTELARLINVKRRELFDLQVQARPELFEIEQVATLQQTGACIFGNRIFIPLPCDFYNMIGLEIVWGIKEIEAIPEGRAAEVHRYEWLAWGRYITKAYVIGSTPDGSGEGLWIMPAPPAVDGTKLRIRYIPVPADLTADTSVMTSVNGWEKLITLGVAMEILSIQGRSAADLMPMYQEQMDRILRMARERNAQEHRRVRDVDPEAYPRMLWGAEGWIQGPK